MMNKKQTSKRSIFKYTLLIPAIGALVFFNSTLKLQAGTVKTTETTTVVQDVVPQTQDEPQKPVYSHVEVMPSFPDGEIALMQFLMNNLHYPVIAQQEKIEGRVIVRFVVGSDGTIGDVEIMRSLHPACDEEAIRVVEKMPQWEPGRQNGEAVSVYFVLPIVFKLQENNVIINAEEVI